MYLNSSERLGPSVISGKREGKSQNGVVAHRHRGGGLPACFNRASDLAMSPYQTVGAGWKRKMEKGRTKPDRRRRAVRLFIRFRGDRWTIKRKATGEEQTEKRGREKGIKFAETWDSRRFKGSQEGETREAAEGGKNERSTNAKKAGRPGCERKEFWTRKPVGKRRSA